MKSHKAFTLIELLVVIAIIAILAAILFPVFAQAKAAAKKTQSLSNIKQSSLGILQYMGDADDTGPLGQIYLFGYWNDGYSGWQYPSEAGQANSDGLAWGNSTFPYIKSTDISKNPSSTKQYNPYGKPASGPGSSYTYNGDLQSSSSTSVVSPAATVLVWSGFLNAQWVGRTWANPRLNCPDPNQGCVYVGGDCGDGNGCRDNLTAYSGNASLGNSKWVHGQGDNFAFVDGHARFQMQKGSYVNDPWASGNSNGIVVDPNSGGYSVWVNAGHTCLFGLDNPCGL